MHHYIWALKILRYNDLFINFFRFRQQARVFNKNNFTNKRNLEQNYSLWKFFVHYEIFSNYIISSDSCKKKLNLPHLPKSFHVEPSPIVATTDHRRPLLLRSPPMILTSSTWTGWRGRTRTGRRTWTFSHSHLCWMSCKKIKIWN